MSVQQRVEQLISGKSHVVIDSARRSSGVAENFTFTLPTLLRNVKSVRPLYAIISNCVYNVTNTNNIFSINRGGPIVSLGIPAGTYNINQLIDTLNGAWEVENIQFAYDSGTLKVTVQNMDALPFKIHKPLCTMSSVLGFTTQFNYESEQITHTSNSVVKLNNLYDFVHINVDIVQQYYANQMVNYLVSIPLQAVPFGQSQLINFPESLNIMSSKSFFQTIQVQLTDKDFKQIDNANSDFLLALEIYYL